MTQSTSAFATILFFSLLLLLHAIFMRVSTTNTLISSKIKISTTRFLIMTACTLFFLLAGYILYADSSLESLLTTVVVNGAAFVVSINSNVLKLEADSFNVFGQSLTTMILIIIAAFYYTVQFSKIELWRFVLYSVCVFFSGAVFVSTASLLVMFVAYELILLPTAMVLDYFSKTGRSREATDFMISWTQIGAVCLFFIMSKFVSTVCVNDSFAMVLNAGRFETNLLILLVFFGFGTKMPVWPFYWWLPEAHVEVSTNFSIVLSGVSIKFAFLGFIKFMELLGGGDVYWICAVLALIGLVDASLKVDTESDIKKIVAYQTVAEMHALVLYISLDMESFIDVSLFIFTGHCWISTISFILVDFIARRYHSRNVEHLYGIIAESPRIVKFIFLVVFIFASIPGTLVYSVEFYVQIFGSTSTFNVIIFVTLQCFLVVWSKNIWWLLWGGDALYHNYAQPFSLTKSELLFLAILILQLMPTFAFVDVWFN